MSSSDENTLDYKRLFSLEGKIAIVTGGAGHLGSGISKALAGFGATVMVLGRTEQVLKDFVNQNQPGHGNRLKYFVCDVTDEKCFKKVVEETVGTYGTVDILVNNAYIKQNESFDELTKEAWSRALGNSLTHYFTCSKAISPIMLEKKSGSIINIASIYGFLGTDQRVYKSLGRKTPLHYSVAKGGILQMTRHLAMLWAEESIRVNAVSPGVFPPKQGPERPDYMHELTTRVPLGRVGEPNDLAGVIALLASDASSYITGQNFIVDGGWSVW